MKFAFVCDTPYQILTAMNLYYSCFCNETVDIYIVNQFKDAENVYKNIKKENLFDKVYFLKREENRFMPSGMKRYVRVAYSYLQREVKEKDLICEVRPQTNEASALDEIIEELEQDF